MRVSENLKPVSLSVMLKIIHHSHQWSSGGRGSRSGATWGQKAVYIRRNLPMVERVLKILKLIVISPHDSIKCQSWGGFEKIAFYHYKKAHFYTVGQNQLF